MARKPGNDERQEDFFGPPTPPPAGPDHRPGRAPRPAQARGKQAPAREDPPEHDGLDARIAELSTLELRALAATLSDEALAQLTLAVIRQLRRRLARDARHGGGKPSPVLDRAVRELVATFAEPDDDDGF